MRYFLASDKAALLGELKSGKTLFAFDFDGTLCPIVSHPEGAVLSSRTSELLGLLSKRAPVAVISGRSMEDLRTRVQGENIYLVGNHGAEGAFSNPNQPDFTQTCLSWIEQLNHSTYLAQPNTGVLIENKRVSISLHYRNCANPSRAKKRLLNLMSQLNPKPRVVYGKCVFNLIPEGSPHKGDALLKLLELFKCERALFVGDDVTDEDVFSLGDSRVIGVRVATSKRSQAAYFLRGQDEVDRLIEGMLPVPSGL